MNIRNIRTWCVAFISLIFCFSSNQAAVVNGTDEVSYNQNILFSNDSITNNPLRYQRAGYVYACTASTPKMDMFVAEEELGTCTFICHTLAVGSPRPFYFSKQKLSSSFFSTIPVLADASKFVKYDTVHKDSHVNDSTDCYLPHANSIQEIPPGYFGIFQNSAKQYIMAQFDSVWANYLDCDQVTFKCTSHPYLKGYKIHWYLQTNGTLDFRDVVNAVERDRVHPEIKVSKEYCRQYFSLSGRRVEIEKLTGLKVVVRYDKTGRFHKQMIYGK